MINSRAGEKYHQKAFKKKIRRYTLIRQDAALSVSDTIRLDLSQRLSETNYTEFLTALVLSCVFCTTINVQKTTQTYV